MRKLSISLILAGCFLVAPVFQTSALADAQDNFPAGYFDCLPEPIESMMLVKTRGNSWDDGAGEIVNWIGWKVQIYTAVGVESGLNYTVKSRSVGIQNLDVGFDDPNAQGVWPSDLFAGSQLMHFQHPGGTSPNGGWIIEDHSYRGNPLFNLRSHFCTTND